MEYCENLIIDNFGWKFKLKKFEKKVCDIRSKKLAKVRISKFFLILLVCKIRIEKVIFIIMIILVKLFMINLLYIFIVLEFLDDILYVYNYS